MERDQKMAQWWAEKATASAKSASVTMNPGQPMPPLGLAPPSGTPMTPVSGDGSMPIPGYGFPPPLPPRYYYGPPPTLPRSNGYAARSNGYGSSSCSRLDGSYSVKDVGDRSLQMICD